MGICGRGRGAPDSHCLGCPIGSMPYRHSLLILCTPLPRHTPGIPGQRPNQQKTGENWGKNVPSREKKRNQGLPYKLLAGRKGAAPAALPGSAPGGGLCPGASSIPARAPGGRIPRPASPTSPTSPTSSRDGSRRRGIALLSCGPTCLLPGSRRGSASSRHLPPSLPPSARPSVRPSLPLPASGSCGPGRGARSPRAAPALGSGTMGCCTGRCTLIFLCTLQLVSGGASGGERGGTAENGVFGSPGWSREQKPPQNVRCLGAGEGSGSEDGGGMSGCAPGTLCTAGEFSDAYNS